MRPGRRSSRGRKARAGMAGIVAAGLAAVLAAAPAPAQQVAFEDVVVNLKAADPARRLDALRLLRESGYLEAALAVVPLVGDPVAQVQFDAIDTELSLFLVDEAYTRKVGKAIVGKGEPTLPLLAFAEGRGATIANAAPPDVITALVGALASPDTQVRFEATYVLGVLGPPVARIGAFPGGKAAVDGLMRLLHDPEPSIRLAATHVLGRLVGAARQYPEQNPELMALRQTVGDQIVAGLNDPDAYQRLASMRALGELRHDRGVQALMDQLAYYKKGDAAVAALEALSRIAHPSSLSLMTAMLEARDPQLRRFAVEGIARAGDRTAMASLESRVGRDRSGPVKLALAFARQKAGGASQADEIVPALKSRTLQAQAWDYLVELGPEVVPALTPYLQDKNATLRATVADVLGVIGDQRALPALDAALGDRNKGVAAAAGRSVQRLRPRPAAAGR